MHLFGCKFCEKDAYGNRTVADCERKERKNFDSLLWAIITVFQVLTQEDWNEVLYNGMKFTSPWASIYFVLLMTFGNYVLFNLLVAILVEGFSTEDEPKKSLAERIKEDAIQAIQEEAHSKETSQYLYTGPGGGAGSFDPETRRTSNSSLPNRTRSMTRGKSSRRSSGLDISGRKKSKSLKSVSMRSSRGSFRDTVGYSVSSMQIGSVRSKVPGSSLDWHQRRTKNDSNNTEPVDKQSGQVASPVDKKLMPIPPIITHTCPTPTHTPTSSNHSSPHVSHRRSHKEIKSDRKESNSPMKPSRRKFSLDSSHDRIKPVPGSLDAKGSKHHHLRHSLGRRPKNNSPIPPKILIDRIDILQAKNQSSSSNDEVFVSDSTQLNTNFDPIQVSSMSSSLTDKLLNLPSKRVRRQSEKPRSSITDTEEKSSSSLGQVNAIALAGDQVIVKKGTSKNIVLKKSELYTVDIQNEPNRREISLKEVKKAKRKSAARRTQQENPDSIVSCDLNKSAN